MKGHITRLAVVAFAFAAYVAFPLAQSRTADATKLPVHAQAVTRLLIRNAMVIPGPAVPAYGPVDIQIENGLIARIGHAAAEKWPEADATIDATDRYVMPGIVNTHMHWHEQRVGPIPIQYERDLYLAAGVTTAREAGGNFEKSKEWRARSAAHQIVAPRIVIYPMLNDLLDKGEAPPHAPDEFRDGLSRTVAARRFGAGAPSGFRRSFTAGARTLRAATHVDSYGDVLSDARSTPAASTNLRARAMRRLPTVAFGEGRLTQSVTRYGWRATLRA